MLIHELTRSTGRVSKSKRLGRGNSSGKGNYCGKGLKGQKARSGGHVPARFEGGQTPLYMRLPKFRGFKRHFKLIDNVAIVNVEQLENNEKVSSGDQLTKETFFTLGYVSSLDEKLKLLGKGLLTKKLEISGINCCSGSAKEKVEQAGGSVECVA